MKLIEVSNFILHTVCHRCHSCLCTYFAATSSALVTFCSFECVIKSFKKPLGKCKTNTFYVDACISEVTSLYRWMVVYSGNGISYHLCGGALCTCIIKYCCVNVNINEHDAQKHCNENAEKLLCVFMSSVPSCKHDIIISRHILVEAVACV